MKLIQLGKGLLALLLIAIAANNSQAQVYDTNNVIVQTFAGSGFSGYLDGVGTKTFWSGPSAIVADAHTNLFVWDNGNHVIRKINPDGVVSTFVGGGTALTGFGTNVTLNYSLSGMVIDHSNRIWLVANIAYNGLCLLAIAPDGYVTCEYGFLPWANGVGIAIDSHNRIFYAAGTRVYRYDPDTKEFEVFVGAGEATSVDGNGIFCSFTSLSAITVDANDGIYVADNGWIRQITPNRDVVTIAGGGTGDGVGTNANASATGMAMDRSGNLIITCGTAIRKMTPSHEFTTIAGQWGGWWNPGGYKDGSGAEALFNGANSVVAYDTTIYVADSNNQRVRKIVYTPSLQPVAPADVQLSIFSGLRINGIVGRTYRIESSPDMTTWSSNATILLHSSPYLWIDLNPVAGNRFYRALLFPQ